MPTNKTRWGIFLFAGSILFLIAAMYLQKGSALRANVTFISLIVPLLGLLFSLLAFFIGHFSYPRVHNLKVYLIGYVTGLIGTAYFGLYRTAWHNPFPPGGQGFADLLVILMFINCLAALAVPSYVKYRSARSATLAIVCIEAVLILVARFTPEAAQWMRWMAFSGMKDFPYWIAPVCFAAAASVSVWRVRYEFYLGGLISGIALLYSAAWIWGHHQIAPQQLIFAITPLYLVIGMMVHWFSRMEHRIAYDPLLQIYNREYCSKIISEQSSLSVNPPFGIAMVDIDHFKKVNDTYGHQAGDAVLYAVAQAVCRGVVPQGIACRYGGEELAVFFPQKTTREVAETMEQVRKDIEKIKTQSGRKQIAVTISCGVSHREVTSQSIADVIHSADKALYRAKKGGRNLVRTGKTSQKK